MLRSLLRLSTKLLIILLFCQASSWAVNISSINVTGEDYNTITLWKDAVGGVLTTVERAHCFDDQGALSESSIDFSGNTVGATFYFEITAPPGERWTDFGGTFPTGESGTGFRLNAATGERDHGITNSSTDDFLRINYIAILYNSNAGGFRSCVNLSGQAIVSYIILKQGPNIGNNSNGINVGGGKAPNGDKTIVKNCIVNYWIGSNSNAMFGSGGDRSTEFYNCTVSSVTRGFASAFLDSDFYNCISSASILGFAVENSVSDYNFSMDDSADGANSIHGNTDGKTIDFVDQTFGSWDLHLQSTSYAIDAGSTTVHDVGVDIDGDSRPQGAEFDMGADEFVAAAAAPSGAAIPQTRSSGFINRLGSPF